MFDWLKQLLRRLLDWLFGRKPPVPVTSRLLFVEPEQHYLNYGSCALRNTVAANTKPEYECRELRGSDANPDKINAAIAEIDPALFTGLGHGNECVFTVECQTLYMSVKSGSHSKCTRDINLDKMRGRVVHLVSCVTAVELGPALIANGARAYIGYRDSFWFFTGTTPCGGRDVQSVFLAEFQVEASLMAGLSVGQAYRDSQARNDQEVEYWTTGEGRNHQYAAELARILRINKGIQTLLGDADATVCTPTLSLSFGLTELALGMLPLGMVTGIMSLEEARKQGWMA